MRISTLNFFLFSFIQLKISRRIFNSYYELKTEQTIGRVDLIRISWCHLLNVIYASSVMYLYYCIVLSRYYWKWYEDGNRILNFFDKIRQSRCSVWNSFILTSVCWYNLLYSAYQFKVFHVTFVFIRFWENRYVKFNDFLFKDSSFRWINNYIIQYNIQK